MTPASIILALFIAASWTLFCLLTGLSAGWRMRAGMPPLASPFPPRKPDKPHEPEKEKPIVKQQEKY